MDSDYYYYYFDDCNLINYTNYLGGIKNEQRWTNRTYYKKSNSNI